MYHYAIFMRSVKIKGPVLPKAAPVINDMHTHFLLTQQTAKLGSELAEHAASSDLVFHRSRFITMPAGVTLGD